MALAAFSFAWNQHQSKWKESSKCKQTDFKPDDIYLLQQVQKANL